MPRVIKWGCLAPTAFVILLILGCMLVDEVVPSQARRALPGSASDVQEYYSDSWNGDFIRLIKAKLPRKDYEEYARVLGLTERFDPIKHAEIKSMIGIGAGDAPDWWNPPMTRDTTFFEHVKGDDNVRALNYSNGSVFYLMTSW